jgi:hypothetical protein
MKLCEHCGYHLDFHPELYPKIQGLKDQVAELKKLSSHNNGEVLLGWMDAHRKAMDQLEKAEAKINKYHHEMMEAQMFIRDNGHSPAYIEYRKRFNPSASAKASALDDTPKAH